MKTLKSALTALSVLALLAGAGWGLYHVALWAWAWLTALGPEAAPIVGAVVAGAFFLAWLVRWSQGRSQQAALRVEKTRTYQRFLGAWLRTVRRGDTESEALLDDAVQALLVTASSGVLRAWSDVRALRRPPQSAEEKQAVEKLIRVIRNDAGQATFGFKSGELADLFAGCDTTANDRSAPRRFRDSSLISGAAAR